MQVRLDKLDDPIGFLLKVLQKQADLFNLVRNHPKPSIFRLYAQHSADFDQRQKRIDEAASRLIDHTLGVVVRDYKKPHVDQLNDAFKQAVNAIQGAINFFDDLLDQHELQQTEPALFRRIVTVLQ